MTRKKISEQDSVSVITVVFNGIDHIEDTILSVLKQKHNRFEYIIVDGGSTDGTLNVIEKYKDHIDVLVTGPDKGIYDAMNKGVSVALGEWINFMNCGDRFASVDVLKIIEQSITRPDIIYGDAIIQYPTFDALYPKHPLTKIWKKNAFLPSSYVCKTCLAGRTSLRSELSA